MTNLLQFQVNEIYTAISRFCDKKYNCINKLSYLRGLHLCHMTLRKTYNELEDIYYHYALRPQIRVTQPMVVSCVLCMHYLMNKKQQQA